MNCEEANVLMHALLDGELDAGHARAVEEHIAGCKACAVAMRDFRAMREAITSIPLGFTAPSSLRVAVESKLPAPRQGLLRRELLAGFGIGSVATALAASGVFMVAMRADDQQRILGEAVSAHMRSLQGNHLIDVQSSDQHTVKPWFNGKLDVAPPVADLTAEGFTLIGGRLDYIDSVPVAAIVYRRRIHVINLFVSPVPGTARATPVTAALHGFNCRRWRQNGLGLCAVSDINADELAEFGQKIEVALRT
ncbi:MAG: anti-sigma factor [Pseudolabrys sp.]|nr:anti-sigma factor [Pseudolabrys sp.]MBV9260079.1 anti-sigma factor [Pseudolabrys sp.]